MSFSIGDRVVVRNYEDGYNLPSNGKWTEDSIKSTPIPTDYDWDIFESDGVVVAILYAKVDGQKNEIARGHGHIIHDGIGGYAQASSYAIKKVWEKMNGGKV